MSGALAGLIHKQWRDALIHREQVGLVSSHLIFRLLHVTQALERPVLTMVGASTPAKRSGPTNSCRHEEDVENWYVKLSKVQYGRGCLELKRRRT